jgi:hypothetical protein
VSRLFVRLAETVLLGGQELTINTMELEEAA